MGDIRDQLDALADTLQRESPAVSALIREGVAEIDRVRMWNEDNSPFMTVLPPEAHKALMDALDNPPEPTPAAIEAIRQARWRGETKTGKIHMALNELQKIVLKVDRSPAVEIVEHAERVAEILRSI